MAVGLLPFVGGALALSGSVIVGRGEECGCGWDAFVRSFSGNSMIVGKVAGVVMCGQRTYGSRWIAERWRLNRLGGFPV